MSVSGDREPMSFSLRTVGLVSNPNNNSRRFHRHQLIIQYHFRPNRFRVALPHVCGSEDQSSRTAVYNDVSRSLSAATRRRWSRWSVGRHSPPAQTGRRSTSTRITCPAGIGARAAPPQSRAWSGLGRLAVPPSRD